MRSALSLGKCRRIGFSIAYETKKAEFAPEVQHLIEKPDPQIGEFSRAFLCLLTRVDAPSI
jgi:hypothetical protein